MAADTSESGHRVISGSIFPDRRRLVLTARESAIVCLIAGGFTTAQVAARLHISRYTVAQHISAMLRQAPARTRGELIARAYVDGILERDTWPPRLASV